MGPKSKRWRERFKRSVLTSTHDDFSPVIERGQGVNVMDVDGNRFIETNSQVGIASLGHNHPEIIKALKEYLEELRDDCLDVKIFGKSTTIIGSDYVHPLMVELAEELIKITPGSHPKKVGFKSGGGEAIDSCVKFLRKVRPERPFFVSFIGGFHGRVGSALQLTCSKYVQIDGYERSGYFTHIPFNGGLDYLKELIGCKFRGDQINAVFIEFVQGEGGIVPAYPSWVEKLVDFCKEYDIKIVDDEIQTGLGRTGKMWACEYCGVVPDILVTSKALGAGMAIAAFVVNDALVNENLVSGWDSETYYAPPWACVAALATIKTIEKENLVENACNIGKIIEQRLRNFETGFSFSPYLKIRGVGLMWGLEFRLRNNQPDSESRDRFLKKAVDEGLLVLGAGRGIPPKNPSVRFLLPLVITENEVNVVMDKIEKIISRMYS